ncbi:hypothetical protein EDD36DRAFT_423234 [Exophiala viscosa]|uniref:Uncharacterized protein n=1 Tax=Exophiala viscosa TaxID=2486360 RepID=A0AAN6I8S0_9EURO|nr:hypothetical protein EDD36DRAFT_423234 [Exophiala viscosa]
MAPQIMDGVALITGAGSGIGAATAHAFVDEGVTRIILADINLDGVQAVAKELEQGNSSVRALALKIDTSSESDVQRMVDEGVKAFGAIHYCVNAAGVTSVPRGRSHELDVETWDRVHNINLRGVWLCARAQIRQMLTQEPDRKIRGGQPAQRGGIVNISSIMGFVAHPTLGSYSATKAGVLGVTRTDAVAYARDGIRVNAVCPGFTMTPLVAGSIARGADYNDSIESVPIGRWGSPDEIAQVIVFLASERASLVTAEEVIVDGGHVHRL